MGPAQATSDELFAPACAPPPKTLNERAYQRKVAFTPPVVAELIVFPISDTLVSITSVICQSILRISVIRKTMKSLYLFLYYAILQYIPMQPMPGYKIGYALRRRCVKRILGNRCGKKVVVKDHCYFGNGNRLTVGDNSQMGQNAKLLGTVTIGKDVLMGPDVVIMATSHGYEDTTIPIRMQPGWEKPIAIGDNVWIGTRVIILPGVQIGNNCIIGSGAVVTHSFPDNSIIGGVPAKLLKTR